MRLDPDPKRSVAHGTFAALWFALASCRPAVAPEPPRESPSSPSPLVTPISSVASRAALVGEMCPLGAAGRPGLAPLAVRAVSWSNQPDEMMMPIARGAVTPFAVLGFDGRRVGWFSALGPMASDGEIVMGSYAGASACARADAPQADEPSCAAAQRGCGLALAGIGPPGRRFEDVDPPVIAVGGACALGGRLAIDVDADGTAEGFALASFVEPGRGPAAEVVATAEAAPACVPTFSSYGLAPAIASTFDTRHRLELDVLGVLDVDGDGRHEVIVGFRYPEARSIAVYSAIETAGRLELVGETAPWRE